MEYSFNEIDKLYDVADTGFNLAVNDVNELITNELDEFVQKLPSALDVEKLPMIDLLALYVLCRAGAKKNKTEKSVDLTNLYSWLESSKFNKDGDERYSKFIKCMDLDVNVVVYKDYGQWHVDSYIGSNSWVTRLSNKVLQQPVEQLGAIIREGVLNNILHVINSCQMTDYKNKESVLREDINKCLNGS